MQAIRSQLASAHGQTNNHQSPFLIADLLHLTKNNQLI